MWFRYGLLFFLLSGTAAESQAVPVSSPTSTNSVSVTPPPSKAIPLPDIVRSASTAEDSIKETQNGLVQIEQSLETLNGGLPITTQEIDRKLAEQNNLSSGSPSLFSLQHTLASWSNVSSRLSSDDSSLTSIATQIASILKQLDQEQQIWKATLGEIAQMPPAVGSRVTILLGQIEQTQTSAKKIQSYVLDLQSRLADQRKRVDLAIKSITVDQDAARHQLFTQDSPTIWDSGLSNRGGATLHERESLAAQLDGLESYVAENLMAVLINIGLMLLFLGGCIWLRKAAHEQIATPQEERGLAVLNMPLATAFLCAVIAAHWLYAAPPRLLLAILDASAIVPAVIILRRILQPELFPILYAIVAAYFMDQFRALLVPAGAISRFTFIGEILAIASFLLWLLHSDRLAKARIQPSRIIRSCIHLLFGLFLICGLANALGYVHLADLIGSGTLQSSYVGLVIYAAVLTFEPLIISFLSVKSLDSFHLLKSHRAQIHLHLSRAIRFTALGIWVFEILYLFSLLAPARSGIAALFATQLLWGSLSISIGSLFAGGVTIWAAFFISKIVRFVLEEEIYPRVLMDRGLSYAISSMIHYSVLVLGFLAALGAIGIDSSKLLVFAGALGVGVGFGLQNIVNNFVAGIILLFERPIKIGDTIQVDTAVGVVERIGIRSSMVRLSNGSELILPNGNLISNPVTNWSLSSSNRIIEIPLAVASKLEPAVVMKMLKDVALADSRVLRDPEPQVLLTTLSGAALTYRIRVWIGARVDSMEMTSDLSLALSECLTKNNIALA